ncbi:MAG: ParA family protein, partial [Propionibacteriaceae bacterium]|nr:ParA family protein [Propionibacteriaceae bacterium]
LLTVGMLKGGASRTTTAVYLALALHARAGESVLLVDADPANGTAYEWVEDAGSDWPARVGMEAIPVPALARRIPKALEAGGYAHLVIDTGNSPEAIRNGLEASDHLVVPMAPSKAELQRFMPTLETAAQVAARKHIEVSILLTRVIHGTRSRAGTKQALAAMGGQIGLHVLDTEIPQWDRFRNAVGTVPADLFPYNQALEELFLIDAAAKERN